MGMVDAILARWHTIHDAASGGQNRLNDTASLLAGLSKFIRLSVQIAVVAVGAVLVTQGEVSAGALIAASILLGRALAPVDQAIGCWKQIAGVRSAWSRVDAALRAGGRAPTAMRLPEPQGHVSVERLMLRLPGSAAPLLNNISFDLQPGESMAIVGPSAAGKSLLCKVLAGIVPPSLGSVRIDHAELAAWHPDDLRPHVGYLPQEIALFPGSVGDNIARLGDAAPEEIIRAARLAGVHELILRLPDGYQTDVGEFGHLLSGGQRQRIALARAVLGRPKLVILDEPNSNLDPAGEAALVQAIVELKTQGCTVVVVSHKLGIVQKLDKTLLLRDGAVQAIGPSAETLSILMAEARPAKMPQPMRSAAGAGR
jgi:ATP-binding cassette subfamily C protein/ATP-binding cassette subfamily C protein EexD